MSDAHTHDGDALTVGCPACVAKVALDQRRALIADAPLRRCTWTCSYIGPNDDPEWDCSELTFDLVVRVPASWTGWEVDAEYSALTGDAFLMALPTDTVPMSWTDHAVESMDVEKVHIGPIVPEPKPVIAPAPSLFDE